MIHENNVYVYFDPIVSLLSCTVTTVMSLKVINNTFKKLQQNVFILDLIAKIKNKDKFITNVFRLSKLLSLQKNRKENYLMAEK